MKDDERIFLDVIQARTRTGPMPYPRQIADDLGMNAKRASYICEKWACKGWYDYGVNVLAGWLTDLGMEA